MATNPYVNYFNQTNEYNLYSGLIEDGIKFHGIDVNYLPRQYQTDELWNEDIRSSFSTYHTVETYIENFEGFQGDGDLLQQLGLSISDELILIVHPDRFTEETDMDRPLEGDLIYFGLTNGLFEVKFVEHEEPWYQFAGVMMYKLRTQLLQFNQEDFTTGLSPVDSIDDAIADDGSTQNTEIEEEANESQFDEENPFGSY